jgi:uncharacterized protein (TIGR03437 family)
MAITHGSFSIDLNPAVFGSISAISVFSASDDQQGVARLSGQHADVVFSAASGGIGRLPNLPVAEITAPVLATAAVGAAGAVTVQSPSTWYDVSGTQYTVSFQSAGVPIGAGMSIQSVVPGGGQLAAGTVVAIKGQGFSNSTQLELDGVAWSNLQYVSPSLLNISLAGTADLTGKLFQLTDASGSTTRYYSSLTPSSVQDESQSGYWPIFPAVRYEATYASPDYLWFENDTGSPIGVVLTPVLAPCTTCDGEPVAPDKTITVPAGGIYLAYYDYSPAGDFPASAVSVTASAPIRMLLGLAPSSAPLPDLNATALSPVAGAAAVSCNASTVVDYRMGDAAPAPIPCSASLGPGENVTSLTAGTDDGNPWLQVSPVQGSTTNITVLINPAGLALGTHLGVVTVALSGGTTGSAYIRIVFNVNANAIIAASSNALSFEVTSTVPAGIVVTSTSPSVPITASSSASWLTITPTSATTPATLTASITPSAPPYATATITVKGPGNTLVISVDTDIVGFLTGNTNLTFTAQAGTTTPMTGSVTAVSPFDFTTATDSGGNWLSAVAAAPAGPNLDWTLTVQANPSGLVAGLYHGTVTATPTSVTALGSTPIPVSVTLSIWNNSASPPVVSPDVVGDIRVLPQYSLAAAFNVSTGPAWLPFSVTYASGNGLTLEGPTDGITPALIVIGAQTSYPGTYQGSVTITAPPGSANSVTVPITVTALPVPVVDPFQPKISAIVNAGSMLPGAIAPGEIVSVFGLVQSVATDGLHIGSDGKVNRELYGNQVLFNGVAAPLVYMSESQINAVVPYEIAGSSTATVEIDGGGVYSTPWSVPVAASAPGLFTQTGTGQGAGSILNQDNSLNTPQSPAARGSIVQIFLTGEGQTNPPGITGEVTESDMKSPTQNVTVQIGGVNAQVVWATTAPGAIAGLFQVNAVVPAGSPTGSVPVVVRIGSVASQSAATVSVK